VGRRLAQVTASSISTIVASDHWRAALEPYAALCGLQVFQQANHLQMVPVGVLVGLQGRPERF
jgi:hypothetical protein